MKLTVDPDLRKDNYSLPCVWVNHLYKEKQMSSDLNTFCEFSVGIAKKYGIEIAILHGFFIKCHYLSSVQDREPAYPTVAHCCSALSFWDEDKIRELISALYLNKLI